ncbi:MAG: zinc ribbon domain-containing protein [Isosphaeraceae bacterium]
MALVACRSCGAEVSDDAKTCPKCGALDPNPFWDRFKTIGGSVVLIGFVGYVLYLFVWK